ncbi:ATS16-like protein [Mya arenaria]|uniref:ATS16-like protein n=1 Tax=Mya arenaria TaxID=6604 RepID=A0ABY7DQ85_MYAAR|nr:ATS16-like protein [Mya arenaria]
MRRSVRCSCSSSNIKDVDVNISTISDRRIRSANGFPLDFEVRFTSNNVHSDLKLSINDVSDDIPVVLQRAGKMVSYRVSSEAAAFYMDVSNKAAFIVWRAGDTETDNFLFFGSYQSGAREMLVQPPTFNIAFMATWKRGDVGVSTRQSFGTYQSGDRELLVQPPTSVGADHSVAEIEETNPTETDFLVNPEFDASRVEQMVTANAKDPDRVERQATDYEVEIFFVIDYSLYSFWYMQMTGTDSEKQTSAISAIKQFYAFVLNAMSVRYSSVTGSDYTISLVYAGISIATSSTDAPYIENNLQSFDVDGRRAFLADIVLSDFKDWGNTNLKQNYYYDVAMMFTGYEMGRSVNDEFNSATAGFAYTPGACSNSKYSINEDHFRAILATVAAHELGHNLGAQHDGTVDGNGELCSSDDAYVMAPSIGVSSDAIKNIRQFSFSPCSIDYFTAYMTKLNNDGENCLATRTANYDTSDLDPYLGDLAGQVYTPDQQCEYLMGAGSYLSRISYESDYSGICSVMNCFVPGTTSSFRYKLTWEGTTCGDGKVVTKVIHK